MFKNKKEFTSYIDHTFLKADASSKEIDRFCDEAKKLNVKAIAVNPSWIKYCKEQLKDNEVKVVAAIGFPLGQNTIETKCFETEEAIKNGADEIDYVINISYVKDKKYNLIKEEMIKIVEICRKNNVICKVIFENFYLTKEEIVKLSKLASEVKPDFIKTSTGFGTGAATLEDVKLMIENCGDVSVKAAGGIRSFDEFKEFVKLGAKRIGTSSAIKIIEGFKNQV
ncbi:MAG TPA: deoxyribose-phosphate aldolase [Erysipelotrichaceae bacterium]|nr:deoxyribose-phosphate aldolase [Erysipelotrichaceae bacterium]